MFLWNSIRIAVAGRANFCELMVPVDERNDVWGATGAGERARFWVRRIERNAKPLGDGPKWLRRISRHEAHSVGQGNARRNPMRDVPSRPNLMPQQMGNSEARIHRSKNRKPRRELTFPAMRELLRRARLDRRFEILHQQRDRFRTQF